MDTPAHDEWRDAVECDQCGTVTRCTWTNCPFAEEVYSVITSDEWWCEHCLEDNFMDI